MRGHHNLELKNHFWSRKNIFRPFVFPPKIDSTKLSETLMTALVSAVVLSHEQTINGMGGGRRVEPHFGKWKSAIIGLAQVG
jgi:hypothetical protein